MRRPAMKCGSTLLYLAYIGKRREDKREGREDKREGERRDEKKMI
jgi:hypothetical protein